MSGKNNLNLTDQILAELMARYGPLMRSEHLQMSLGYPTREAFRKAVLRGTVPIPIFSIPKRRGKFALTKDVATWLAELRAHANAQIGKHGKEGK